MSRQAERDWRSQPGNASQNATWEDWERWYEERGGANGKQQPIYMSNGSFAALVLAALAVGGVAQATRAESHTTYIVERRQENQAAISGVMHRKGAASAGLGREERIETFVRERENLRYSFSSSAYESSQGKSER
jgi:hypothetical protein